MVRLLTCVYLQLTAAVGEHALAELDARALYTDAVTAQLARETENGRLLRLLAKLSMVTERADADPEWAETGPFNTSPSISSFPTQDFGLKSRALALFSSMHGAWDTSAENVRWSELKESSWWSKSEHKVGKRGMVV